MPHWEIETLENLVSVYDKADNALWGLVIRFINEVIELKQRVYLLEK